LEFPTTSAAQAREPLAGSARRSPQVTVPTIPDLLPSRTMRHPQRRLPQVGMSQVDKSLRLDVRVDPLMPRDRRTAPLLLTSARNALAGTMQCRVASAARNARQSFISTEGQTACGPSKPRNVLSLQPLDRLRVRSSVAIHSLSVTWVTTGSSLCRTR
jgi:hypothetical protein